VGGRHSKAAKSHTQRLPLGLPPHRMTGVGRGSDVGRLGSYSSSPATQRDRSSAAGRAAQEAVVALAARRPSEVAARPPSGLQISVGGTISASNQLDGA
jgi:hypothetical protein